MIKIKRNCKEIEEKKSEQNRSKIGVKRSENRGKTGEKQGSARFRSLCEIEILLRNQFAASCPSLRKFSQLRNQVWHTSATSQHRSPHFATTKRLQSSKMWKILISQPKLHFVGYFAAAKPILVHECHFVAQWPSFRNCETAAKLQIMKIPNFAAKAPFRREFRNYETNFWHTSAISQHSEPYFAAAKSK